MAHTIKKNAKELSEKEVETLKYNASQILANCRRALLNRYPFIGNIILQLDVVPVRDVRVPTACTDGKSIYFDIDFLSNLKPDEKFFVLGHEVFHCVMMHFTRQAGRDQETFNIATDLEVNQILVQDGFTCPNECCMPDKFNVPAGKSAEEYYELLIKKQKNQPQSGNGGSGNGGSGDDESKTTSSGSPKGQFDKHLVEGDDVSKEGEGAGDFADKYGKLGLDPDFKPSLGSDDVKRNIEKVRQMAVAAAQQIERDRGELPGHLQGLVKKLLKPEVDWKERLSQFVTKVAGDKRTWNRPNRRFAWSRTYLPSSIGEKIRVGVILDTSGSTQQDLPKFLGEMNGLLKSFSSYEFHLIQCDSEVEQYDFYSDENPPDLENEEFKMAGGGGTQLKLGFDYININDIDVDAVVILSDGFIDIIPENPLDVPVLWVICKGGTAEAIKFGEIIHLKKDE